MLSEFKMEVCDVIHSITEHTLMERMLEHGLDVQPVESRYMEWRNLLKEYRRLEYQFLLETSKMQSRKRKHDTNRT